MHVTNPRLVALAEELIDNIAVKLGSDDFFAFRLTCRDLEHKSFATFTKEYYRVKCFIFTPESLKVLCGIASNDRLRDRLQEIHLVPSLFSERVFECCQGAACAWQPTTRESEAFRHYIEDQKTLKESGDDLRMLTQALTQLPNLSHITFTDDIHRIPRDVDRRGTAKAVRSTSNRPANIPAHPDDQEYYSWKNHVFKVLLRALAASGVSTLKHFNTDLEQDKNALSVAKSFNLSNKTLAGLAVAFRHVHSIGLNISSRKMSKQYLNDEHDDGIDTVDGAKAVARFAGKMPPVKKLRLRFSCSPSSGALCRGFIKNTSLEQLCSLKLDGIYLSAKYLASTLEKLAVVEILHLIAINLTHGSWPSVLKIIQKMDRLNHLHLMELAEQHEHAYFLKPLQIHSSEATVAGGAPPHDGWDDEYDSGDDSSLSDASMPALEPHDASMTSQHDHPSSSILPSDGDNSTTGGVPVSTPLTAASMLSPPTNGIGTTGQNNEVGKPCEDDGASIGVGPARGYLICLDTLSLVRKYLPIFIKEYNLPSEFLDDGELDGNHPLNAFAQTYMGAAPPPLFGGPFGGPPVPVVPAAAAGVFMGAMGFLAPPHAGAGAATGTGAGAAAGPAAATAAGGGAQSVGTSIP